MLNDSSCHSPPPPPSSALRIAADRRPRAFRARFLTYALSSPETLTLTLDPLNPKHLSPRTLGVASSHKPFLLGPKSHSPTPQDAIPPCEEGQTIFEWVPELWAAVVGLRACSVLEIRGFGAPFQPYSLNPVSQTPKQCCVQRTPGFYGEAHSVRAPPGINRQVNRPASSGTRNP